MTILKFAIHFVLNFLTFLYSSLSMMSFDLIILVNYYPNFLYYYHYFLNLILFNFIIVHFKYFILFRHFHVLALNFFNQFPKLNNFLKFAILKIQLITQYI